MKLCPASALMLRLGRSGAGRMSPIGIFELRPDRHIGSCSTAVYPPLYDAFTGTRDLEANHTIQTPWFSASVTVEKEIPSDIGSTSLR